MPGIVYGIERGTVKKFFPDRGYGFIRHPRGGRDIFFHVREARKLVDLSGNLDFAGMDFVTVVQEGAEILYRPVPDGDRVKASPWGLPGNQSLVEPNYATDSVALLRNHKCGGHAGAIDLVSDLFVRMHELEFRAFCAITPNGADLWDAFVAWREAQGDDPEPIEFARDAFARSQSAMIGPRRCEQPAALRSMIWGEGFRLRGLQPGTRELALLFLEDPATMERLAPSSCRNCDKERCPLWGLSNRRPRR